MWNSRNPHFSFQTPIFPETDGPPELYIGGKLKTLNERKIFLWFWLFKEEILKNMATRKALVKLTLNLFRRLFKEFFQPAEKTGHQNTNWDYPWVGELQGTFFFSVCPSAFSYSNEEDESCFRNYIQGQLNSLNNFFMRDIEDLQRGRLYVDSLEFEA